MATQAQAKYWTYDDLRDLPDDGKRYEIIEGVLYVLPSPGIAHASAISNLIVRVFGPLILGQGGEHHLFTGPLGVFLPGAAQVLPDLMVVLSEQRALLGRRGIEGSPALIVEVLCSDDPGHDRIRKRRLYARAGVREYWLVSPEAAIVEILALDGEQYRTHARVAGDEPLTSTVLPNLAVPASVVFTGLDG